MPLDKSWSIIRNRNDPIFLQGLDSFIETCKAHVDNRGLIRCACHKCQNTLLVPLLQMKSHIQRYGVFQRYLTWTYHGESTIPTVVDDVAPSNKMADVIDDDMTALNKNDTNNEENSDTEDNSVKDELYPGCTWLSPLNFSAKLMLIKENNKWTDNSYDQLLELLKSALPKENKVPFPAPTGKQAVFEKVIGKQKEHFKGVGRQASGSTASSCFEGAVTTTTTDTESEQNLKT